MRGSHIATSKAFVISSGKYDDLYELKVDASHANAVFLGNGFQPKAGLTLLCIKA